MGIIARVPSAERHVVHHAGVVCNMNSLYACMLICLHQGMMSAIQAAVLFTLN